MEIIFRMKKREELGAENEKMKIRPEHIAAWEQYIKDEYADAENEMVKKTEERLMSYEEMTEMVNALKEGSAEEYEKQRANDKQVGGTHYKDKTIQPWDVIDGLPHAEAKGFYRGNAIKYIMRAGDKGPAREDYEKAIHYLEKLLEIL